MSAWPPEIEDDEGERFYFEAEKPGWLIYGNDKHIILVGKDEVVTRIPPPGAASEG